MSETKDKKEEKKDDSGKKTLSLSGKTLSLGSGAGGGAGRTQSVTQGRSGGSVAVEVRRNRAAEKEEAAKAEQALKQLTDEEREARAKALEQAQSTERSSLPERQKVARKQDQDEPEDAARAAELEEAARIEAAELSAAAAGEAKPDARKHGGTSKDEPESYRDRMKKAAEKANKPRTQDRFSRRITVTQAINEDYARDRGPSLAAQKRAREKARMAAKGAQEPRQKVLREVQLPETITVQELANRMAEPGAEVVKKMMTMGVMATINQSIDADTAELVIEEFGHTVKRVTEGDIEIGLEGEDDTEENLQSRPPVVTIMGHVDHGKTSLLDALRETDVVKGEAGGITQHIGAYQITVGSGDKITFIDTPGHAAFTEMRARGANVTDIVVIVVAANDSIMPQTIEAINHAKAAEVPIIVAVNKIDLPDANPEKVKQDLLQHEVIIEDMGGDVQCVEVSAMQKTNLDKLEELIILQSELLELKANPDRSASGVIVEAKQEKGRGSVATLLVQKGTIRIGDVFVAGSESGKVRALINDRGESVEHAIPGEPIEVVGFEGTPDAGDTLIVVQDEAKAREVAEYRLRKKKEAAAAMAVKGRATMEQLLEEREAGEKTKLPIIIKADVHGSIEAIAGSLAKMTEENEDIEVQVVHSGVGGITESDVTLANASGGLIVGFNVRANAQARALAQRDNVEMRYYNVIYNVIDDAKAILSGMLSPTKREEYIGQAKILQVFNITKVGKVAGCVVDMGMVKRGSGVRLLRDDVVIHEGMLKTLKRHQDEVKEVKEGTECGMAFENYDDIKDGDVIECYEIIEEARTVE